MKLMDKLIFSSFVKAWFICFISLISLYTVIDAFNSIEDLIEASRLSKQSITYTIITYYSNMIILIFDRLCPVILPLAATFTISWMRKNNELVPMLSAGIPLHRLLRPIYIGCLFFVGIQVLNRELMLPKVAEFVEIKPHESLGSTSFRLVNCFREPNGVLIDGRAAYPKDKMIQQFSCTIPAMLAGNLIHVQAKEAYYHPAGSKLYDGTVCRENSWLLTQTIPSEIDQQSTGALITPMEPGKFLLKVDRADFRHLTRVKSWYQYTTLANLIEEMNQPGTNQLTQLSVQFHQRMVSPVLAILMVMVSLGLVLKDQSKSVFIAAGSCLLMGGVIFALTHFGRYLGERETLSAPLAAWFPLIFMGPYAFVLRNAMHT